MLSVRAACGPEIDWGILTPHQQVAAKEVLDWLIEGGDSTHGRMATLSGAAGAGKTASLTAVMAQAREAGIFANFMGEDFRSVACAPTGKAVKVLRTAAPGAFDDVRTLHSLLGLTPKETVFGLKDAARLVELGQKDQPLKGLERLESQCLKERKLSAEQGDVKFLPGASLTKNLLGVRLLVVDECGMVGRDIFGYLVQLLGDASLHPDLQVLFLGDHNQLPPVGEIDGAAFEVHQFPRLTEVHRYGGVLLTLAGEVLESKRLEALPEKLFRLCEQMPDQELPQVDGVAFNPIEIMGSRDAIEEMGALLRSGEECRWLAGTRDAVRLANERIELAYSQQKTLSYKEGDKLLCLSPVTRSEHLECRATGKNATMIVPNSEVVELSGVRPMAPHVVGGKTFRLFRATGRYGDVKVTSPLKLLDPTQESEWISECDRLGSVGKAWQNTPTNKRNKRSSQIDLATFAVWDELEINGWDDLSDYDGMRRKAWRDLFALKKICDDVSYSHASTVHKAQGDGFSTVFVDWSNFFMRRLPNYGEGMTHNQRRLAYTAVTRVKTQLVVVR